MDNQDDAVDMTSEYPLDTESLQKGSVISAATIEHAFNVKRGTDAFQMASMRASKYIQGRFLDRGEVVTLTQRKHDLVILTDDEMPAHNARLFRNDIKKAARAHARMLGGDRSKMSDATVKLHDRALTVQGAQLAAISRARLEVKAATRERTTPALAPGKKD
jgi:hypothetical protein